MPQFVNFPVSVVAVAPSPASSGTSLTLTTGHGVRMPDVPFQFTVWPASSNPDASNAEIVTVTARAGDVLTIVRAQENSAARSIVVGDLCAAAVTARTLSNIPDTGISLVLANNIFLP